MSAAALPAAPSLSSRLGSIITGLQRTLAVRAAREPAFAVILLVLWNRLGRLRAGIAALVARQQAGRLRKPPASRGPRASADRPPPPADPLPRQRGWLLRHARESGVYGHYLQRLLEEPEMAAVIEQIPQLRRLLRPLWRMLHREPPPPILQALPPAEPPARRKRQRPPRVTARARPAARRRSPQLPDPRSRPLKRV